MKCTHVVVDGLRAIVCGRTRLPAAVCACGNPATKLCDWVVVRRALAQGHGFKVETCDAPLCDACTTAPAPGKDLCRPHALKWETHPARRVSR